MTRWPSNLFNRAFLLQFGPTLAFPFLTMVQPTNIQPVWLIQKLNKLWIRLLIQVLIIRIIHGKRKYIKNCFPIVNNGYFLLFVLVTFFALFAISVWHSINVISLSLLPYSTFNKSGDTILTASSPSLSF